MTVMGLYGKNAKMVLIDIETTVPRFKGEKAKIFDVSFALVTKNEILEKFSYFVEEFIQENPSYCKKLAKKYDSYIDSGIYQILPFAKIMEKLQEVILENNVKTWMAYNAGFDGGHISRVCKMMEVDCPLQSLKKFDIYRASCEVLVNKPKFKKWATKNGKLTESGNYSTTAQTIFQYLSNDLEFVEEHTGYADIDIEMQIFHKLLKQKKGMSYKVGAGWSVLNKKKKKEEVG